MADNSRTATTCCIRFVEPELEGRVASRVGVRRDERADGLDDVEGVAEAVRAT
jgi:hypothetical protein